MSDVPSDLFREILLRLPAEDLFRFRAVCKAWCHTIDDPSFIKSHAINQKSYSCTQLVMTDSRFRRFYCLSLTSLDIDDEVDLSLIRIKNSVHHNISPPRELPTTTCHGLILISPTGRKWVIWNPLTGILLHFLRPCLASETHLSGVGLGYDYATDDYKVVCLIVGKSVSESHVLELHMDVLDGCLFLSRHYCYARCETERGERLEMWTTEDETMWIKLFSFDERGGDAADLKGLRPVAYSKSKGQVFLQRGNRFYLLDIHEHSMKKLAIVGLPDCFSSQSFCGSLIRLHDDDGVGESNAARLRKLDGKKKIPTTAYSMRVDNLFHLHSS